MDTQNKQPVVHRKTQVHHDVTWIDVEAPNSEVLATLEHDYHLHPVHLRESMQKVQHTQVEREDQYLFFVLHVPIVDTQADKITINQVGVFLGKGFLVTIRTGACPSITALYEQCGRQAADQDKHFGQGSAYLLYTIIRGVLSDISDMTENVIGQFDAVEDLVFDNNRSDAMKIGRLRQKIVKLRGVIGPKRFILQDLTQQVDAYSDQPMSRYYSNNTKTVTRLWEVIEEAKETVEIYKDADFTTSTEQTNRILAILTLVFTFTIPITVVGTLYGMNVPMPGSIDAGPWTFLGTYTTFWIVTAVSSLTALAMFTYFKAKKWF